jgi:hypothetical protein
MEKIRIYGSPRDQLRPEIREAEQNARIGESAADQKIIVSARLDDLHPLAQATLQRLRKEKPNEHGVASSFGPELFRVSVSPTHIDRSIRILNAVARAAEERGFALERGKSSACLRVNGEQLEFLLRERVDRAPHTQTPAEAARAERERRRWPNTEEFRPWWLPQWDYSPSGKLMLELEEHYHSGLRRVFSEGKRQRLEEVLNDFMAAAISYSTAQKARIEEHERWRLERQERERRNIERQQQIERTKRRWEFLSDRIEALERAEKID